MEKNVDSKGRWRNRNVGFRVSEEEAKLLDDLVELSGLAKQDYILRRLLNREVVVQGNPKVFKALKNQMTQIYEELKRLESVSDDNKELLIVVEMVAKIMKGMVNEYDVSGDDVSDNIRTIKSIPLELYGQNIPSRFEIRGEVILPKQSKNQIKKRNHQ